MFTKKMGITLLAGAILGVVCIIGASLRSIETLAVWYLFAFWFNRVVMGFVFGLLPTFKDIKIHLLQSLLIGLFISFAFYSATNYQDLTGFLAGGVYGIILGFITWKIDT